MTSGAGVRAIVLTSTMRRHQFVANTVAARMEVAGVWQEEKSFQPLAYADSPAEEAIITRHFAARDDSEHDYFAMHDTVGAPVRRVAAGGCNDAAEIARMRKLKPDIVLVFGTGLLAQSLLDAFPQGVLNIHLGLSPYYRGAGTNFWPLVNGEPEYCGATIHFLDRGVDSGPIIGHVRPDIARDDGPHDIGNKTIVAAADSLVTAAVAHASSRLRGVPQRGGGRVYRRADFSAAAVRTLYSNFANGMIPEYLDNRAARDANVALVPLEEGVR